MAIENQDQAWMERALALAARGQGFVEPNPMVGCVLVKDQRLIGEGWHEKFGGPHAEVNAIRAVTEKTTGATAFVTLEPCAHHGKTPPCSQALIAAKVGRVVVAHVDPNPQVSGKGIRELQEAGIQVDVGLLESRAANLLAPYLKRLETGNPWIIAKWAMTLGGKIASSTGDSQWISNKQSRAIVHQLRGRVDAIMIGSGTAIADDPLLTARPAGARVATRIVVDSHASLTIESQLCQTANEFPVIVAAGPDRDLQNNQRLNDVGCEVWCSDNPDRNQRLMELLVELGRRGMSNVLVEGGSRLLGSLNDLHQIDEVHTFIGPKLIGGANAPGPIGGDGKPLLADALQIEIESVQQIENDVYIVGRRKS